MDYWSCISPSSWFNSLFKKDGTVQLTANWNVGNKKITGLSYPTGNTDVASKKYVDDNTPYTLDAGGNYDFKTNLFIM